MPYAHRSVMAREVLRYLGCIPGGVYVDGTFGGGGHALGILEATAPGGRVIGLDRDGDAVSAAAALVERYRGRCTVLRENFRDISSVLASLGIGQVDGVLLDLGVSSYQLESAERGFSFRFDTRLDMRMDRREEFSAYELVNGSTRAELERIFRSYGEFRGARRLAGAIERARGVKPVTTTGELAGIVLRAFPPSGGPRRVHPATKVFQAIRIAVNDELGNLSAGLVSGFEALKAGGRLVVISFHSLEDRIVKRYFRDLAKGCTCPPRFPACVCGLKPSAGLLTKRVVTPLADEVLENPRARSSRLRAVQRL